MSRVETHPPHVNPINLGQSLIVKERGNISKIEEYVKNSCYFEGIADY